MYIDTTKNITVDDWHQLLLRQLFEAQVVHTRLGFAHVSIGNFLKFDLTNSFPATRAKRLFFDQVARELYCFLKGYTSKEKLHEHGVHIWDADMERAQADSIGAIYGYQWRKWPVPGSIFYSNGFDQLRWAIDELIDTGGTSRRAVVSSWNQPAIMQAALPPCHVLFQFNIVGHTLYTDVYQRSADAFLGLPFDVASYAILSRLVRDELSHHFMLTSEVLNYHISNLHLYHEHRPAVFEEITTLASEALPVFVYASGGPIGKYPIDDYSYCELQNYSPTKTIKAKLLT